MNFQQNSLHIFRKICYIFSKCVATVNNFLLKLYVLCHKICIFTKNLKKVLSFNIFPENKLENAPNGRLYKEKLCKKRKRKVKAHKL